MDNPAFHILSICSGVGMLDEGFERALEFHGRRTRVVAYVEREASAAAMLLARMEEQSLEPAPVWCGNIEDLPLADLDHLGRVDCVLGGIPCQPFSQAGKREGTEDERWLWPLMRDLAGRVGASWIGIENVGGFVRDGLAPVLHDLAESGWAAEWLHLSASEVGASHRRERIFLLANAKRSERGEPQAGGRLGVSAAPRKSSQNVGDSECAEWRASHDAGGRGSAGDDHERKTTGWAGNGSSVLADTSGAGQQGRKRSATHGEQGEAARRSIGECGCPSFFAPGPDDARWADILEHSPHLAPAVESGLCVLADGLALALDADRSDALRATGNGVVALCASVAFTELFFRIKNQ